MINRYFGIDDLALVDWAHGVNSQEKLDHALKSNCKCIEADVLLCPPHSLIPIMSHPPHETSDLTYEEFLAQTKQSSKVIKIDFKTQNCVKWCLEKLAQTYADVKSPIILNADVFKSDFSLTKPTIDAEDFLKHCTSLFPNSILSIGWTTTSTEFLYYTWFDIFLAYNKLKSLDIKQEITFPIKTNWSFKSIHRLHWLLTHVPGSTITLWSHENDHINHPTEWLLIFRRFFHKNQVIYDIPLKNKEYLDRNLLFNQYEATLSGKNDVFIESLGKNFNKNDWIWSKDVLVSEFGAVLCKENSFLASAKQSNEFECFLEIIEISNGFLLEIEYGEFLKFIFDQNFVLVIEKAKETKKIEISLKKFVQFLIQLNSDQRNVIISTHGLNTSDVTSQKFELIIENCPQNYIRLSLLSSFSKIGIEKLILK